MTGSQSGVVDGCGCAVGRGPGNGIGYIYYGIVGISRLGCELLVVAIHDERAMRSHVNALDHRRIHSERGRVVEPSKGGCDVCRADGTGEALARGCTDVAGIGVVGAVRGSHVRCGAITVVSRSGKVSDLSL